MTLEEAKIAFIGKRASDGSQMPIRFWWTMLRSTRARLHTAELRNTSGRLTFEFAGLCHPVLDLQCLHGSK